MIIMMEMIKMMVEAAEKKQTTAHYILTVRALIIKVFPSSLFK